MNTLEKAQEIVKNDVFSCLTTMVTDSVNYDNLNFYDFSGFLDFFEYDYMEMNITQIISSGTYQIH
ncbi:hypothetical protein [Bathymodiolus japonicus methanotrophic gill symbiont]|uniref:hypothetical protein n=1 Tax=Bathymodiolus japonicus methanotrophic gill symbiont TaxID=113269 RepID=UPI001C8E406B|nr:hypothetical protein [Bathymodiolus japonicus methanotrophic gill symbiont]